MRVKKKKVRLLFLKNFYLVPEGCKSLKNPSNQRNNSIFSGYLYNMKGNKEEKLPQAENIIAKKILTLREKRVMLDRDLAVLYGVETRTLNQAVKRRISRFPEDFMFQLNNDEFENLRSQFVISKTGGRRYLPFAFTEHGILMLSSVLNSETAIQVNIQIMRVFVKIREVMNLDTELKFKFQKIDMKLIDHDKKFGMVFDAIREIQRPSEKKKRKIGFDQEKK